MKWLLTKKSYKGEVNAPCLSYDWFCVFGIRNYWDSFTDFTDDSLLLLSMACFAKSSKRFETWLYQTKLYQTYVADYRETKSIAKERKKWILLQIYILMGISIYLAPIIWVKLALGALTIFITYYLLKVIPNKSENQTEEDPD